MPSHDCLVLSLALLLNRRGPQRAMPMSWDLIGALCPGGETQDELDEVILACRSVDAASAGCMKSAEKVLLGSEWASTGHLIVKRAL